jgi:hypothetical protein
MKQISSFVLMAWMTAFVFVSSQPAHSAAVIQVSDPSPCLDSMETVPVADDLMPILIAMDGGCQLPQQTVISI